MRYKVQPKDFIVEEQAWLSFVPDPEHCKDHIGKLILQRDAEGALRAYLTHPFVGDPRLVRKFKTFAAGHWGDWDALFDAAPPVPPTTAPSSPICAIILIPPRPSTARRLT